MAEMVGSAVVQEAVSRAVSLVFSNHEEKPSKRHTKERLETAHIGLEFALERSSKLPITDVSLLRQRRQIKRVYEECGEVLDKHKVRVLEDEEGVTNSSSFPKRIIYTVKSSVSYYLFSSDKDRAPASCSKKNKDELSLSQVIRFERYADEADRFLRRVESGCSLLPHYMFFNPLITQLLQGKRLSYRVLQGSKIRTLWICPVRSQEHGILAKILFSSFDRKITRKCFNWSLWIRLSESTDIIGIVTKCLQSLGPQFKSFAQVAAGELSQLPTQDFTSSSSNSAFCENRLLQSNVLTEVRPDPLCCMANGHMPCANNVIPSDLSYRFPEQVIFMHFKCSISAFEYNMQSSAVEAARNVVNDWPLLMVSACFWPHSVNKSGAEPAWPGCWSLGKMWPPPPAATGGPPAEPGRLSEIMQMEHIPGLAFTWLRSHLMSEIIGKQMEHISGTSLQQADEMLLTNAVNCFIRQPELTCYGMDWNSLHGGAYFIVEKPKGKVRPKPIEWLSNLSLASPHTKEVVFTFFNELDVNLSIFRFLESLSTLDHIFKLLDRICNFID